MMQTTLQKFGYPNSLVKEYKNWLLLCRQQQVTLGSLVLIAKEEVTAFSALSAESFSELNIVIKDIEKTLKRKFNYDKINYLMLMMIDPEVHFHVLPRYADKQEFEGRTFVDQGWPMAPDLSASNEISAASFEKLVSILKATFGQRLLS